MSQDVASASVKGVLAKLAQLELLGLGKSWEHRILDGI